MGSRNISEQGERDMTNQTQGLNGADAEETILVRLQERAYGVPVAVLEQHRIPQEQRAALAAKLRERTGDAELPVEAPLFELPEETLEVYRLTDAERAALEAQAAERDDAHGFGHSGGDRNPWPIDGYTGYHRNEFFGGVVRGVFIGVFPKWQPEDSPSGPYPGLR
jgi:hypothetical protein